MILMIVYQIPGWLKQELATSELDAANDDGNEADDTSDHETEEEGLPMAALAEASLSSIQINRNLRQGRASNMVNSCTADIEQGQRGEHH